MLLNRYSSVKKKLRKIPMIFDIEIDFKSQILALFDTSPLHQFSKFKHFLWVCWFLGKNSFNFLPPLENSTTRITIVLVNWCWWTDSESFLYPWYPVKSFIKLHKILRVQNSTFDLNDQLVGSCSLAVGWLCGILFCFGFLLD